MFRRYKEGKKVFIWLLTAVFLLTQVLLASPVFADSSGTGRIAGDDRYKTAVAVSQKGWKTADYAVLARGDNYADALCAGPLAIKYNGPILLTEPQKLNSDTLNELKRLGVKHIIIAGGLGAVSQSVEDALKAGGLTDIERVYGDNRYQTSVKIAEKLGSSSKVVLATGNDFPDALSISVIASKLAMPILLTGKDSLPGDISNYLQGKSITQTYIVGGTGVISPEVEKLVPGPYRLSGNDRYETNIAVLKYFESNFNFENMYVAIGGGPKGNEFADALTGAVLAAKTASPLVLANQVLPTKTGDYIKTKVLLATKVTGLGGAQAVPGAILTSILAYKEQIAVAQKYDKAGTYGPETGKATISGSVTISVPDVTLRNTIIEGDLLLAQSIGDGNVYLKDVTVKGKTIVNGGGPNSVIMYNFNGQTVIVDVPDGSSVRLVAQGSTSIADVTMEGSGTLQEENLTGTGFVNVVIPAGAEVILNGAFTEVEVEAGDANVTVATGSSITTMTIAESAAGADINLSGGTTVSTLNANAASNITGQGQITTANINTNGVTIAQPPSNVTFAPDVKANINGQEESKSSTGGGGDSYVPVTGITLNKAAITLAKGETATLVPKIAPGDVTNKSIIWTSSSDAIASVVNGVVTAVSPGTAVITARTVDGNKTATCSVRVTAVYDTAGSLGEWQMDRTNPLSWNIADNIITFTTKEEPANNWYAWQGKKAATDMNPTSGWKVDTELELDEQLLTRDGVRTSMWLNVVDAQGESIDWAILQFKIDNTTQTKGWQYWDSNDGKWLDISGISTAAGKYQLSIHYNNGTIAQFINGTEVNSYDIPEANLSYAKEVIFNSYSFGKSYTAKWKVPDVKYYKQYPTGTQFASTVDQLKAEIGKAPADGTIILTKNIVISSPVTVNKKVTITSLSGIAISTTGTGNAFVLSEGAKLYGLTITKTDNNVGQNIIQMFANTTVEKCVVTGQYVLGDSEITRAIEQVAGSTGIVIKGNTFKDLRQPAYLNGDTGEVKDNYVTNTRGWVVCGNSHLTLLNNTFGTNAVDIAIIPANEGSIINYYGTTPEENNAISAANNGAYVENQLSKISSKNGQIYKTASITKGGTTTYFRTIQDAVNAAIAADTVMVAVGTYDLTSPLNISKAITVEGMNKETVILKGAGTIANTVSLSNGATLKSVTVTRDNSGVWSANVNNSLVAFGQNLTADTTLENCIVKHGRNGVYLNNTAKAIIKNNLIDNNRTGIQMANSASAKVENNVITNNHTVGVLLQWLSADNYGIPTFTGNTIQNNWYSDFENRWPAREPQYNVNLTGNTFTDWTTKIAPNSGEPGYNDLRPVELGGDAVRPALRSTFVMATDGNLTLPLEIDI